MKNGNNEIILSICIPTINRSAQLDETLESITNQKTFKESKKVEIVISDNCSSDNTFEVVNKYINKYPSKIVYSRNSENILDKNFEKVLSLASGHYLKLNNDTLKHKPNSLDIIIKLIEENIFQKPVFVFTNGLLNKCTIIKGNGMSFLLNNVSYYSTWVATFGIWRNDFYKISNFNKASQLQLTQVDVLFDLVNEKENIVIENKILFQTEVLSKKGGYDLVTVFLDNYSFLLRQQLVASHITKEDYENEMSRVINNFLTTWLAKSFVDHKNFNFVLNNSLKRINQFHNYNLPKLFLFYKKLIKQCFSEVLKKIKN